MRLERKGPISQARLLSSLPSSSSPLARREGREKEGKERRRKGTIRSGAPKKRLTCGTKKERLGILSFPHDCSTVPSFPPFLFSRFLRARGRGREEKVKPVYARMIPDRHRMTLRNTRPVWKISWASFLLQQIDPPTIKHLSSTVDQSEKEEMDVLPVTPSRLLE